MFGFYISKKKITFKIKRFSLFLLFGLLMAQTSCKKLVEVPAPATALTSDNVYNNDATAAAVLTGIYTEIASESATGGEGINSISLTSGLSADELTLYGGSANSNVVLPLFYQNKLSPGLQTEQVGPIWSDFYAKLYTVNIA